MLPPLAPALPGLPGLPSVLLAIITANVLQFDSCGDSPSEVKTLLISYITSPSAERAGFVSLQPVIPFVGLANVPAVVG